MLVDRKGRHISYLRISVTDRCNLRCIYCMPSEGVKPVEYKEILRYEEIIRIASVAARLGTKKIRLTGGEPLRRRDIIFLIEGLSGIKGLEELTLTTNGVLLKRYARALRESGLTRINVSLDSLNPDRYREMTRGGELMVILDGIEAAEEAGLTPISINMVPVRGVNDNEIEDFARLTFERPYRIRFIEFMPIGSRDFWSPERYVSMQEIKERVESLGVLEQVQISTDGPARYWRFRDAKGWIGFISALSNHFCNECNRLRITSDGKIRPCLFSDTEIDLKPCLRGDGDDTELERLFRLATECKPEGHGLSLRGAPLACGEVTVKRTEIQRLFPKRSMSGIGG